MLNLKNLPYTLKKVESTPHSFSHGNLRKNESSRGLGWWLCIQILKCWFSWSSPIYQANTKRMWSRRLIQVVLQCSLFGSSLAPFIAPKSLPYSRVLQAPQEQKLVVEPPIWKKSSTSWSSPIFCGLTSSKKDWNHMKPPPSDLVELLNSDLVPDGPVLYWIWLLQRSSRYPFQPSNWKHVLSERPVRSQGKGSSSGKVPPNYLTA